MYAIRSYYDQMESFGEDAKNFVNFRRGKRLSWESIQELAKEAGQNSAILSLFILDGRSL